MIAFMVETIAETLTHCAVVEAPSSFSNVRSNLRRSIGQDGDVFAHRHLRPEKASIDATAAQLYLPPTLALIALSFAMALAILFTRSGELIKGTRPISYFEDFDGLGASVTVMRPTRQLANLFEFPVLFYAAAAILIALGIQDGPLQRLFWAYTLFRWLHAAGHLLINRLWIRTPIFALGNVILLTIWIRICVIVFN